VIATDRVTLGEGATPLLRAPRLSNALGLDVLLKWEGANPTGSFKDRGMAVAVTRARAAGARAVICASTGNTAASASAYAARAGLRAVVLQPHGAVAAGKLAQARALGARILSVRGSFGDALDAARELAETIEGAELFLYPGDRHLFADSSLPDYDETAAALLRERVTTFLSALD
jgi:threonine synthase